MTRGLTTSPKVSGDGGRTFRPILTASLPVTELTLSGRNAAAAALTSDALYRSANGTSWRTLSEPRQAGLVQVAAAGPLLFGAACAAGAYPNDPTAPGALVRSSDGGTTWRRLALPAGMGCPRLVATRGASYSDVATLCVASPRQLYALAGTGEQSLLERGPSPCVPGLTPLATLYASRDGGASRQPAGSVPGDELLACRGSTVWSTSTSGMTLPFTSIFRSLSGGRDFCLALTVSPGGLQANVARPPGVGPCPGAAATRGVFPQLAELPGSGVALFTSCVDVGCAGKPFVTLSVQDSRPSGNGWERPVDVFTAAASGQLPEGPPSMAFATQSAWFALVSPGPARERAPSTMLLEGTSDAGRTWRRLAVLPPSPGSL